MMWGKTGLGFLWPHASSRCIYVCCMRRGLRGRVKSARRSVGRLTDPPGEYKFNSIVGGCLKRQVAYHASLDWSTVIIIAFNDSPTPYGNFYGKG